MRIGEVSELSGVSVRMLRHYDRTGLLHPSHRTSADYRDYSPADLDHLFRIEALRSLGLSLAEVRKALNDPAGAAADTATVLDRLRRETRARIRADRELLTRLDGISGTGPTDWEDALRVTALLTALREGSSRQRQTAVLQAPDRQPVDALVASYLEEPDENAAGALRWSLVRAGEDAVPALVDRAARAARAARSARTGEDPDSPAQVRRRLVEVLAGIGDERTNAAMEGFLADVPEISAPAALALARRGVRSPGLVDVLVRTVVDGTDDTGAADALAGAVVAGHASPEDVTAALRTAADGAPADVRLRVVQALAEIPGETARAALGGFTGDPDHRVAGTARVLIDR